MNRCILWAYIRPVFSGPVTYYFDIPNMWPDLTKGGLDAHIKQIHFPPPIDRSIHRLTIDGYFTVHSSSACLSRGLFLLPVWCPRVHGCSSNGPGASCPGPVDSILRIKYVIIFLKLCLFRKSVIAIKVSKGKVISAKITNGESRFLSDSR